MELPIRLSMESSVPIYHQIERQLKALIAGGQLQVGHPLPSIRVLSKDLQVSSITVQRAYQNLVYAGFIRSSQGKGTFVAELSDTVKQQIKVSSVYETLEAALETALDFDYTLEQIEEIFQEIIQSHR